MAIERVFNRMSRLANMGAPMVKTAAKQQKKKSKKFHERKDVQKALDGSRAEYIRLKQEYEQANRELAKLQQEVDMLQSQMNKAREEVLSNSDRLQTMDLSGANACKDRKDMTTYIIDGKEHVVNKGDSPLDMEIMTLREFMSKQKEGDEDSDPDMDFAANILSSDFSRI